MSEINLPTSAYTALGLIHKTPMSGYDLKAIAMKINKFYGSDSNAQIYPMLKKLEDNGLVKSQIDPASGARKRKIYEITESGKKVLKQWLEQPTQLTLYREDLLRKISLGQFSDKKTIKNQLINYKNQLIEYIAAHKLVLDHIEQDHKNQPDYVYLQLTHSHLAAIYQAKLAWCEEALEKF